MLTVKDKTNESLQAFYPKTLLKYLKKQLFAMSNPDLKSQTQQSAPAE